MTITLLAVIVLLLVGLAAFTRVETAVAGNTQRQAQARENALLALNLALGQLQKHAGPDRRVTATSEWITGTNAQKTHYTGVWNNELPSDPPLWLVSGLERGVTEDLTQAIPAAQRIELVGARSTGAANAVVATVQTLTAAGIPGTATGANTTIGRYAWWVGDEGVKAPVAHHDRAVNTATNAAAATTINYAPWDSIENRRRIRQQIGLGAGAADPASGAAIFEPRTSTPATPAPNSTLANNTVAPGQLAFFRNPAGTQIGLTPVQQNFWAWSANNAAVLANTRDGGLRRDLSLRPDLLGAGFAAWEDYRSYWDDPRNPTLTPTIEPPYAADPLRRRYRITPPQVSPDVVHSVAPVLAMLGLSFNVRTQGGNNNQPLEVRARWYVSLWNPYTAALVPEDLRLEIEGLPDATNPVAVAMTTSAGVPLPTITLVLPDLFQDASNPGRPFPLRLSWPAANQPTQPDYQSWLPGRTYTWISNPHSATLTPAGGLDGSFYVTNFANVAGQGDTRTVPGPNFASSNLATISFGGPIKLVARLYRASDTTPLATFNAPDFQGVTTTAPQALSGGNYQFGFQFRLFESGHNIDPDKGKWLIDPGASDVRSEILPAASYRVGDPRFGDDPALYQTSLNFADTKFLLDRTQGTSGSESYNEDAPLFELPRAPILSLGMLQHLRFAGQSSFAFGNSAGAQLTLGGAPAHATFDQYFFSGLSSEVLAGFSAPMLDQVFSQPLPNPLLQIVPRQSDGRTTLLSDVLRMSGSLPAPTDGFSSATLVQRGAFNFNSVSSRAWLAMLRTGRFANGIAFAHLNASASTGTNADSTTNATPTPADAVFYRFPQSAHETFEADSPALMDLGGTPTLSTYAASSTVTGTDPTTFSSANTHLFRRGMRALSATETTTFADAIVARLRAKLADSGPYRTVEELVNPVALFADATGRPRGLIEAAIEDAALNASIPEFSSQWLTQADVMTALAPFLFPRSDTFTIRTYGEVVNPATNAVEGRAWCEATVQRLPEYFNAAADAPEIAPAALTDPAGLNQLYGRRFKIVSFRWLTRSDI